ncbi:hypothetical protein [Poritiphilus flavus]|uniref:Uncharacterized protein n=1 Tax=Poritiphilus flavus TaxID=2697053 RepID=A0A6L9EHB4_9FLAO|nr:hypothetical protein [Poritiphilus flavus]NAS14187.1 hypothetical protein [Poritiphilus flavus]
MKKLFFCAFMAGVFLSQAQSPLDPYKYVIVPKKFSAFKNENQHQTSTLIKYLLTQRGYNAVYEGDLPADLASDRCLGVVAHLEDNSSLFATKTSLTFENCEGKEVFITKEGRSKEKEYKASYSEAIQNALESFDGMEYVYTPKNKDADPAPITVSFKNDIKNLEKETTKEVAQEATTEADPVVKQVATPEEQSYENKAPQPSAMTKADSPMVATSTLDPAKITVMDEVWYAQELANGYQLVDSAPKIRLKLMRTSMPQVYFAENEEVRGMVYQKGGKWIFEYYEEGELKAKELKLKF